MDYDMISSLKVEELKKLLRERGLKITGRRVELVARVFAALENNVPLVQSAVEFEADLKLSYNNKLVIDGISIQDPNKIEEGWLGEEVVIFFQLMKPVFRTDNLNLSIL